MECRSLPAGERKTSFLPGLSRGMGKVSGSGCGINLNWGVTVFSHPRKKTIKYFLIFSVLGDRGDARGTPSLGRGRQFVPREDPTCIHLSIMNMHKILQEVF